jgi:potassium uptake TrkH family protein
MFINWLNRIRESINLRLYPHKEGLLFSFRIMSFVVSALAISSIVYYHGFPRTSGSDDVVHIITRWSLAFYVLKYFIGFFYDFHPLKFLRRTWFEGVLVLIIVFLGLFTLYYGASAVYNYFSFLGVPDLPGLYILFVQLYVFVMIGLELVKASQYIDRFNIGPAGTLILSFVILIASGTALLMLPEMTTLGHIRFIDALFTSTSASCVTGLTVLDTSSFYSLKGQIIIMLLIQLGGINIVSFATFFATFYGGSGGIRQQSLLKDLLATRGLSDTRLILRRILAFSFLIELAGALFIFITWRESLSHYSTAKQIFHSVFHSISAFNNAGFSTFPGGLMNPHVSANYLSHWVIACLIILGGIGFSVLQDVFGLKSIMQRRRQRWKKLQVQSKIVLFTSAALVLSGTVIIFFLEIDSVFEGKNFFGTLTSSVFQAITARTAGFNTIDTGRLSQPALLLVMVLMYIGASPGSTGGGIKTTTFLTLFKASVATIKGKKNIEAFKHNISFETVDKAYSVALFSFVLIVISTFILSITEKEFSFVSLLFEEVSAFSTVGLSMGITPYLSDPGRLIIIVSMFIGRIGTLTLAIAFLKKASFKSYSYPRADIMIG